MINDLINDLRTRMGGTIDALSRELSGLRTGRASVQLLDPIMVEAYGGTMPLSQVGTVTVGDARLLVVQVWDKELVKATEKAIREAGLGLNPMAEGQTIRVPLPDLTQERRQELIKIASKYAEEARVSVRGVRRTGMDALKKMEKDKTISEDDEKRYSKQVQDLTDEFIKKIDDMLTAKEKDISHI